MNLSGIKKINISTLLISIYLLLIPFDFVPLLENVSISKVMAILPFFAILLNIDKIRLKMNNYIFLSIMYIILHFTSLIYSVSKYDSLSLTFTISSNIILIYLLSCIRFTNSQIKTFVFSVVISSWLILLVSFISTIGLITNGRLVITIFGYTQDPNYLVGFVLFAIIYYINDYLNRKKKISLIFSIVFSLFVIITGSRGGLISVIISILYAIFMYFKRNNSSKDLRKLLTIFSLVIFAIFVSTKLIPDEILSRYSLDTILSSRGTGRYELWGIILNEFSEFSIINKLFGIGAGTTFTITNGFAAHNIWLDTLVGLGLLGVSVLFLYYFSLFIASMKNGLYILNNVFVGYLIMGISLSLISFKPMWNVIFLIMISLNSENIYSSIKKSRSTNEVLLNE